MRSFVAAALCLSLVQQSTARIPHSSRQLAQRDANPESQDGILSWLSRMVKSSLKRRQDVCYDDEYYEFVNDSSFGESFCQAYMKYPNTTTTVDYTPGFTRSSIVTTYVYTDVQQARTTPVTTVTTTVTPGSPQRRDAAPARLIRDAFALFNRQTNANGTTQDTNSMSSAFSSACACQTYSGVVVTVTYTDEPTPVTTVEGFARTTTTVYTTRTAGAVTSTVTVTAAAPTAVVTSAPSDDGDGDESPSDSPVIEQRTASATATSLDAVIPASSASSVSSSQPTTLPFACPEDNNTIVTQMVENERFDYLVLCDFDLPSDPTFYGQLAYGSFDECAAACSMANANFDEAVCRAAAYFESSNTDEYNCLLKSSSNTTVPAVGVDLAVLQKIAVGVDSDSSDGTAIESMPFASPTSSMEPSAMSSEMSSMMDGSSNTMAMITPAPVVAGRAAAEFTAYSTYVSGGSTYSTGSYFSTYYTSNGSWYYTYYSTYTVAWASAQTVVAYGADSTAVSSTNQTTEYVEGGDNGGYVTVTNTSVTTYTYYSNQTVSNTTDTVVYSSFAANNSFITASTTRSSKLYTQTVQAGSDSGSNGGGSGGGGSGPLSSASVTLITSSIASASSSVGTGVVATPAPSISSTVIYTSYGTGGEFGGSGGGPITVTSTIQGSTSTIVSPVVSTAVTVESFATGGGFGGGGSGAITIQSSGFGSAFSGGGSGALSSTESSTDTFGANTGSRVGSGSPPETPSASEFVSSFGTGGATSGGASGPLSTSTIPDFSSGPGYVPPGSSSASSPASSASESSPLFPTDSRTGFQPFPSSSAPSGSAPPSSSPSGTSPTESTPSVSLPEQPRTGFQTTSSTTEIPDFPSSKPGYQPPGPYTSSVPSDTDSQDSFSNGLGSRTGYQPYPPSDTPSGSVPNSDFTNSLGSRTGVQSPPETPSGTVPISPPFVTGPTGYSTGGFSSFPVNSTGLSSVPSGTVPTTMPPMGTDVSSVSSGFSNTGGNRTGTAVPPTDSGTVTLPPMSTGPVTTSPANSSCPMATTTVFTTVTLYGCYSQCLPNQGGYYSPQQNGPQAFGSPPDQ